MLKPRRHGNIRTVLVCWKVWCFFSCRFLCDLRQFSSFIPTCCQLVSADKTLSALAVRPFTLILILNLTHPSHSNISWLPFLKISSLLQPSIFPSILLSFLCPSLTSPFSVPPLFGCPVTTSSLSSPASIQIRFLSRSCSSCCRSIDVGQTRVLELPTAEDVQPGSQNRQQY